MDLFEGQADSAWKNWTHLGTDYSAILVEPGYRPVAKVTSLPADGNGVVAVSTTAGRSAQPVVSKVVHFSGYDWKVRTAASDPGGLRTSVSTDGSQTAGPLNAAVRIEYNLLTRFGILRTHLPDVTSARSVGP